MSSDLLSTQMLSRLRHSAQRLEALMQSGWSEQEAEAALWQLCLDEGELPLDLPMFDVLYARLGRAKKEHIVALMIGRCTPPLLADKGGYTLLSELSQMLRAIGWGQDAVLVSLLSALPVPFSGLVALLLVEWQVSCQEERLALPPSVLPSMVSWYFEVQQEQYVYIPTNQWAVCEPWEWMDESVWLRLCREVACEHAIRAWEQFPKEALSGCSDEELVAIALRQDRESEALFDCLRERKKTILPLLEAQLFPLVPKDNATWYRLFEGQLVLPIWLELALENDAPITEEADPWLHGRFRTYVGSDMEPLLRTLLTRIPVERAVSLVRETVLDGASMAQMFGLVEDDRVFAIVIHATRSGRLEDYQQHAFRDGFVAGGTRGKRALLDALSPQLGYAEAYPLLYALLGFQDADILPDIAPFLGHSSKIIRELVGKAYIEWGEEVLPFVKDGLLASRKAHRLAALEVLRALPSGEARDAVIKEVEAISKHKAILEALALLPRMDAQEHDSPLAAMDALYHAVTEDEKSALLAAWDSHSSSGQDGLPPAFAASPENVFAVLLPQYHMMRAWELSVQAFHELPLVPWLVVHSVTQSVECSRGWRERRIRDVLSALQDVFVPAICALALRGNNALLLLSLLAEWEREEARAVFVEGLAHQSKPVRELAVRVLSSFGNESLEDAISLLQARKKATRLAAAHLIGLIAAEEALPSLEEALASEKTQDVTDMLHRAIAACTPQDERDWLDATEEELDTLLAEMGTVELPHAISRSALPRVLFASGRPLSLEAQDGWLYQLSQERIDFPNALARTLRERLDRDSVEALGLELHRFVRYRSGLGRESWLKDQLSISATASWLYDLSYHGYHALPIWQFACHGTRCGALLLMTANVPSSQQTIQETLQKARESLPASLRPTEQEVAWFHSEREQLACERSFFSGAGECRVRLDIKGYTAVLRLALPAVPELGCVADTCEVVLFDVEVDANADPDKATQAHRLALRERERLVGEADKAHSSMVALCREHVKGEGVWTQVGWRRLCGHPFWRLAMRGVVFANETGVRCMLDNDWEPVTLSGEVLAYHEDDRLRPVSSLNKREAQQWEQALAGWMQQEQQTRQEEAIQLEVGDDSDRLLGVRELLYSPPSQESWRELVTLLESWPNDDSLDVALQYIEDHAGHWGELKRMAPENWSMTLLHEKNDKRQGLVSAMALPDIGEQPRLLACNGLALTSTNIRKEDARSIVSSSFLKHIRHMSLRGSRLYSGADEILASGAPFSELDSLSLENATIRPKGWKPLAAAPWFQSARSIRLEHTQLSWKPLEQIVEEGGLSSVEHLFLAHNAISLPAIQVLEDGQILRRLRSLSLSYRELGEGGMLALAESEQLTQLESLTLFAPWAYESVSLDGVEALASSEGFPSLKKLHILVPSTWGGRPHAGWVEALRLSKTLPQEAIQYMIRGLPNP